MSDICNGERPTIHDNDKLGAIILFRINVSNEPSERFTIYSGGLSGLFYDLIDQLTEQKFEIAEEIYQITKTRAITVFNGSHPY